MTLQKNKINKELSNRLSSTVIETSKYIPWSSLKKQSNKISGYIDKLFCFLVFIFILKLILMFAKVLDYLWFGRLNWFHCDFVITLLDNLIIYIENEIICIIIAKIYPKRYRYWVYLLLE